MFASLREKIAEVRDSLRKEKVEAVVKGEVLLDKKKLDVVFSDFEISLLEGDVALEVAERLISDLKKELLGKKFKKGKVLENALQDAFESSLKDILVPVEKDIIQLIREKKGPFIITFVGVNGGGKTTTIAKVARYLEKNGLSSVLAASDTYRAGAIEQLERHSEALGIRMIKQEKGSDPAAVAFDAVRHAEARGIDAVLIDTAGRMETNVNLLDEMKKIARVSKSDLTLFVGDSLTGNAAIEQAKGFANAIPLDGIILTKIDADAKGGSAISISHVLKCPIFFLGVGQEYDDLVEFRPEWLIERIIG